MEWKVLEDITLSDHLYISFNIDKKKTIQPSEVNLPRWNTKKLNERNFENKIQCIKRITDLSNMDMEEVVNSTITNVTACCNASMPKVKEYNKRKIPVFWWTPEIGELRSKCLHARRMATRNHYDTSYEEEYKKARKTLRKAIKSSKKEKWKELCSNIDADPWGKPYKIITKKLHTNKPIPGIKEPTWAAKIVTTLFPSDEDGLECNPKLASTSIFIPFAIDELKKACNKLKVGKSPGPDGIPNEALKLVGQLWPEVLLATYNKCFINGKFPKCWKTQKLVLLRKGTKPLNIPNSYRPLCMINTLGKLYESLICNRLEEEIKMLGGLSAKQYGFQKGKSTVGAINEVVQIATASKKAKGFCIVITLDIKNAFNTVKWKVVLDSCKTRGINSFLYNAIADYLYDRVLLYETDNGIKQYSITAGVPQGSVLGPLLWNIMYDGLLNTSLPKEAHLIGYADDIALVISHTLPEALEIIANDSLNRCSRWLREHGLNLAVEKTEAILITDRRSFKMPELRIQGNTLTFSQSLRYLGVELDRKLNFNVHIQNIRDKALKTANMLTAIMPNVRGPKDSTRRLINSVIYSQLLYAAPIYASVVQKGNVIAQILKPQRLSALRVISAYRTVSTSAALVLSGTPPIDLLIMERKEIWTKLISVQQQEGNDILIQRIKEEARQNLLNKWQERWDADQNGRWTHRMIPHIKNWIDRKHGDMNFYMTQIMTGHGNFNAYLERFKIKDISFCADCGATTDNAEHVLFHCPKWNDKRISLNRYIGVSLTPENFISKLLTTSTTWKKGQEFVFHIMSDRNTEPLISQEDGGIGTSA